MLVCGFLGFGETRMSIKGLKPYLRRSTSFSIKVMSLLAGLVPRIGQPPKYSSTILMKLASPSELTSSSLIQDL